MFRKKSKKMQNDHLSFLLALYAAVMVDIGWVGSRMHVS